MFIAIDVAARRRLKSDNAGQSMLEFLAAVGIMLAVLCVLVDFGRALNYEQVMIGLTRQGSNLASRGDTVSQAAQTIYGAFAPLNPSSGQVIVTSVQHQGNSNVITGQQTFGSIGATSKIGTYNGNPRNPAKATVPASAAAMLAQNGQTVYITEIFYNYQSITPLGKLVKVVIPSPFYQVAYF